VVFRPFGIVWTFFIGCSIVRGEKDVGCGKQLGLHMNRIFSAPVELLLHFRLVRSLGGCLLRRAVFITLPFTGPPHRGRDQTTACLFLFLAQSFLTVLYRTLRWNIPRPTLTGDRLLAYPGLRRSVGLTSFVSTVFCPRRFVDLRTSVQMFPVPGRPPLSSAQHGAAPFPMI